MAGNSNLTRSDIYFFLQRFDQVLKSRHIFIKIVLCGGSLSVLNGWREVTDDIDSATEIYSNIQKVIEDFAEEYNNETGTDRLEMNWLNDGATAVLPTGLPAVPDPRFDHLTNIKVSQLTDEAMLISKVKASRPKQDWKDIRDAKDYLKRTEMAKSELLRQLAHYGVIMTDDEIKAEWANRDRDEFNSGFDNTLNVNYFINRRTQPSSDASTVCSNYFPMICRLHL